MNTLPLLGHASLDDILAWRPSGPVRVREFLADVDALAAQFPVGRNVLNVCQDRYRFTVGFAAGLVSGRTSLRPAPSLERPASRPRSAPSLRTPTR